MSPAESPTESPTERPADGGAAPLLAVLGPIVVRADGAEVPVPARLDRTVLAHLLLAEGRALSVELLVEAVWGQCPPPRARNALQVKISRLRRLLDGSGAAVVHAQGTYRLVVDDGEVDARLFGRLVGQGEALARAGRYDEARDRLERAVALWRGEPLSDLDEHPRVVAARLRLGEEWASAQELLAEIALASAPGATEAVARLRRLLDRDPLRPRARLLLMQALERSGRRADALAAYEEGRRLLAAATGLTPPPELQEAFAALLVAERAASRRPVEVEVVGAAPAGAIETARWLVAAGEPAAAASLALRGAWWWWFGGRRTAGRDLLEDLVGREADTSVAPHEVVRLSAWLSVFEAVGADAERALRSGEQALARAHEVGWSGQEALAAVLLAERLHQRGARRRGHDLLHAGRRQFVHDGDEWGTALADVVDAKATLLTGDAARAARRADTLLRTFEELGDPAGQVMALDLAGYCAEVQGDLVASVRTHRRALDLARRSHAPEWEAAQMTRLGSVLALLGSPEAVSVLEDAVALAADLRSGANTALAENGLGLAATLAGDGARAVEAHASALRWYERQESPAGISYSAGRLAEVVASVDSVAADRLARRAADLAERTGDPRALAHGLEAVAFVASDPVEGARALGAARTLRTATAAPLPPPLHATLLRSERALHRRLGDRLVDEMRLGARDARRRLAAPAAAL